MATLTGSVGHQGKNEEADVITVQTMLNEHVTRLGLPLLIVDGDIGDNTVTAIRRYQQHVLGAANPDGRIDVGGATWRALSSGRSVEEPAPAGDAKLSGAAWWHANQAKFPNSNKIADLTPPFREHTQKFLAAMTAAGARLSVAATLRHPSRAYLMHFAWKIAHGLIAPADAASKPGVPIRWDHGNLAASRRAAREMVDLFGMAHPASLNSIHIEGRAIDMTISWAGTLSITDAGGKVHTIGAPHSGANGALQTVGASYKVFKLASDPPHWSATGH